MTHRTMARTLALGTSMAALVLGAPVVLAQDQQADELASPADAVNTGGADGVIIVTAQRREQRLQDVPISVAVVGGDALQDRSIKNFADLSQFVPNLTITKTPGADAIFMRGIGSGAGSPTLDQSVVLFIDGIYAGKSRQFMSPFLDIERLEVLRGPQGALVGKNTSAGAINIITRRPGQDFEGYASGEYDFVLDGGKLEGGVTMPLGGGLRLRAVGKYSDYDGWVYNTIADRKEPQRREIVGRGTLAYDDGPVSLTLKGEIADVDIKGNPFAIVAPSVGRFVDLTKETGSVLGPEFDDINSQLVSFAANFDIGDLTLTSISGYSAYQSDQREDADFIERDLAYAVFKEDFEQWSQEVRLLSPTGGTFEWAVGAYFQWADLFEERATGIVFSRPASSYRTFKQGTDLWSVYGQATFRLSDQLSVIGSGRYTRESKSGRFAQFAGPNAATDFTGTFVRRIDDEFTDTQFDPSASVQYRPTDNAMVYASYAQGSKSGGFQGAISNAQANSFQFEPETSKSFEVGGKFTFPGRGYLNIAAFDTTYSNLQLSVAIQTGSTTSFAFYTGNAGEAKARGIEVDGAFAFNDMFSVSGGLAWTPTAKYTSYPAGPCATGQTPTNPAAGSCDLTGIRLGFSPKFTGNITPRLEMPLGAGLELDTSATLIYRSSARNDFAADVFSTQDAFVKLDARIAVGAEDESWELALLGRNLTDKRTFSFGGTASLASNPAIGIATDARQFAIDLPRTIAVQGTVRF